MSGSQSSAYKKELTALLKAKRNYFIYVVGAGKWYNQQETVDVASYADFVYFNRYQKLQPNVTPQMSKAVKKGNI